MHGFTLEIRGTRYHAAWLRDGDQIQIRSDYGRAIAPLRGKEPGAVAREVLEELVSGSTGWGMSRKFRCI